MDLGALRIPEGLAALAAAAEVAGGDPATAIIALRAGGLPPGLAADALTQARLRLRARGKFGPDAARLFFTAPGLEQATRAAVADRRAERLRGAGVRTITDLGCGIGADSLAFARAGIRVYAVEADPMTAAVASANAAALGLDSMITVTRGPAEETPLDDRDAVFCDPARRSGGRRVFDPAAYSPPWDFVAGLPGRVPRTVLKLAPGIDHALIPAGAEAEWTSVDGDVVEATFWCGPLAQVPRRATVLRGVGRAEPESSKEPAVKRPVSSGTASLTGSGMRRAPVDRVRRYLYDPDGAVVRAHLVAEFASTVEGVLADPEIAYVYASEPVPTPFGRLFEVDEVLPFSLKRLRAALRERRVGRVEILKRGSPLDPARLRRDLRLSGPAGQSVVLTRVAGAPVAVLCQPVAG